MKIPEEGPIYFDFSGLSTFRSCQEKYKLRYEENLVLKSTAPGARNYGSAFHAGVEAFYVSGKNISKAEEAFVEAAKDFPLSIDDDSKRTIERGISLLYAYADRWKDEPYELVHIQENALEPGKPLVEQGFAIYLCEWRGRPVFYVGRIDRIMRLKTDGKLYPTELKTTSSGLSTYLRQTRPNHQLTGYYLFVSTLFGEDAVGGVVWDCVYVSDRKPDPKKPGWMKYGVDQEKDLGRALTQRSKKDVEEFLFDARETALEILELADKKKERWIRSAPTACFMYGQCDYIDVCKTNRNPTILETLYSTEVWEPYKLTEEGGKKNG